MFKVNIIKTPTLSWYLFCFIFNSNIALSPVKCHCDKWSNLEKVSDQKSKLTK